MTTQARRAVVTRHAMLEGFLRRLACHSSVGAFALRGGMLVRHWFPNAMRAAGDVDLVCSLPYNVADLREVLSQIMATSIADGVDFEAERFRIDSLRPESPHPGMRLFAVGKVDDWFCEISVDLTFSLDVWPQATRSVIDTERGNAALWVCQPEMLIGRKLQVIAELGQRRWRPKDLHDVWLMLRQFPQDTGRLGEALERSFHQEAAQVSLEGLFEHTSWWQEQHSSSRWGRRERQPSGTVHTSLFQVVAEVQSLLAPVLSSRR